MVEDEGDVDLKLAVSGRVDDGGWPGRAGRDAGQAGSGREEEGGSKDQLGYPGW